MDSPDLQFKYQKLAFEYSKLRAQNQVLKRAVKDEQEKVLQLKEDINSRDQSLRKAEQELDSLSFRNQQLTKRLSLLQEDLEISKARKGSTRADSLTSNYFNDSNVYAEELESKIQENARLHAELKDLEPFYKNKIIVLENKLEEISRNAMKRPESIYSNDQDVRTLTNRFEEENISPIEENREESDNFDNGSQRQPFSVLEDKKEILQPKTLIKSQINDAVNDYLGAKPSKETLTELIDPVKELSLGFTIFTSSYLLLLKKLSSTTTLQLKVVDELSQEVSTWEELGKRFEDLISRHINWDANSIISLKCLSSFYESIIKCSSLVKKLHIVSERYFSLQNTQLENTWKKSLGSVSSNFASLIPYVSTLTYIRNDGILIARFTQKKAISLLQERISKLLSASNELLTAWSLLMVEDEEETKNSLLKIHKSLCKINFLLSESIKDSSADSFSMSSSVLAQSPETPHLPYSINAVSSDNYVFGGLHENLSCSNNEVSLVQQLYQATNRLAKLEEEREYWKLESQLLSHRLKKENIELSENRTHEHQKHSVKIHDSVINNSIIGELQDKFCPAEEREKQIRDHFTNRCSQLFLQLTSCISQAALYQNECENLLHCLSISEDSKALVEKEIEEQRREKTQIQEALSTTSRNYEEQISAMSEHIADMNEKITLQAETIEQLSFQLKKKSFK